MRQWIKAWWEGEFEPYDNDPQSSIVLIGGQIRRHWTSRAAHRAVNFLQAEWKWVFGATIALATLVMTYIKLS